MELYFSNADDIIASGLNNSFNVYIGSPIDEYNVTISGNDDIIYDGWSTANGAIVTLTSISGNNYVTSFKMNGKLIKGNQFVMPDGDVTITDITTTNCTTFETDHYPYLDSQDNVVIGEKTFEGATSLTVILDYQTQGINYDYFYIYDSSTATEGINNNKKYGGRIRTKETITINGNYIKITFTSKNGISISNYYGMKAIIIPNY